MQEHPLIVFRDSPAGRRARLIGGPDVWEVARAVRSTRAAEPDLGTEELLALVCETSGVEPRLIRAALDYWSAFRIEIDHWLDRADAAATEAEHRWHAEQEILGHGSTDRAAPAR